MEKDPILQKYENEGFGKNAFGWYFNPWIDEYDPEYDPHNDKEYNKELDKKEEVKEEEPENEEHKIDKESEEPKIEEEPKPKKEEDKKRPKPKKESIFKRAWEKIQNVFSNKKNRRLPESEEKTEVKDIKTSRRFSKGTNELLESITLEEFNEKFRKIDKSGLRINELEAIKAKMKYLSENQEKEEEYAKQYIGYDPTYYELDEPKETIKEKGKKLINYTSKKLPLVKKVGKKAIGGLKITGIKTLGYLKRENPMKTNLKVNNLMNKYYVGDIDHERAKQSASENTKQFEESNELTK